MTPELSVLSLKKAPGMVNEDYSVMFWAKTFHGSMITVTNIVHVSQQSDYCYINSINPMHSAVP